ncbi:MAG: OapB/ArvB family protein [Candidatus Heimdallarchaeaceae archaeon]
MMKYRVDFIPYAETNDLSKDEKIRYILSKVMRNTILVLENGLTPSEEMNLISKTMVKIDFNEFVGLRLFSFDGGADFKLTKLFGRGSKNKTFTIVAPNEAVSVQKDKRGILSIRIND